MWYDIETCIINYDLLQGKSLSLICGALTWLKEYEEKQRKELEALLAEEPSKNVFSEPEDEKKVKGWKVFN